jgi:hypothetical protein
MSPSDEGMEKRTTGEFARGRFISFGKSNNQVPLPRYNPSGLDFVVARKMCVQLGQICSRILATRGVSDDAPPSTRPSPSREGPS